MFWQSLFKIDLTRNPEIEKTSIWILSDIWCMEWDRDHKLDIAITESYKMVSLQPLLVLIYLVIIIWGSGNFMPLLPRRLWLLSIMNQPSNNGTVHFDSQATEHKYFRFKQDTKETDTMPRFAENNLLRQCLMLLKFWLNQI